MKRMLPALLLCGVLLFSARYPRMGLDVGRLLARAVRDFRVKKGGKSA